MVFLQNNLNLKVSQRQVLTPGLVQMVSVLALNKLELKEMINTEMIENPMLEELEETVAPLEEIAGKEGDQERSAEEVAVEAERVEKDPFDEIDFGSYFQDYLDPGYRTASNYEELDSPSFENFLSQPSTLTDHLLWQLGALKLPQMVSDAAELIIGNLNEDGYLTAGLDELVEMLLVARMPVEALMPAPAKHSGEIAQMAAASDSEPATGLAQIFDGEALETRARGAGLEAGPLPEWSRAEAALAEAVQVVQQLDPVGVGARDLKECLLAQIRYQRNEAEVALARRLNGTRNDGEAVGVVVNGDVAAAQAHVHSNSNNGNGKCSDQANVFDVAECIVGSYLPLLQRKDMKELGRAAGCGAERAQQAMEYIRTLDPRPGQRYNLGETRLIEPDVAFVKRDDEYHVVMNEEDLPSLRLSQAYRKLLRKENAEKEVRDYVKERYKSAIQLMRNIEQRKNTILRTCESIVRRQTEFLERGVEAMKPMMIKEVAEEIGVHPSTVSRAVANKYVHTAQGVFELRFFFSEGVSGPEGGGTPLMLLKRKVKKLIEDEDPRKPLTDDHLAALLQQQGIDVTRRTVAKYREDLRIPSTHQRRVRN